MTDKIIVAPIKNENEKLKEKKKLTNIKDEENEKVIESKNEGINNNYVSISSEGIVVINEININKYYVNIATYKSFTSFLLLLNFSIYIILYEYYFKNKFIYELIKTHIPLFIISIIVIYQHFYLFVI